MLEEGRKEKGKEGGIRKGEKKTPPTTQNKFTVKEIVRLEMEQQRVSEHENEQEVLCKEKRGKLRMSKAIKSSWKLLENCWMKNAIAI